MLSAATSTARRPFTAGRLREAALNAVNAWRLRCCHAPHTKFPCSHGALRASPSVRAPVCAVRRTFAEEVKGLLRHALQRGNALQHGLGCASAEPCSCASLCLRGTRPGNADADPTRPVGASPPPSPEQSGQPHGGLPVCGRTRRSPHGPLDVSAWLGSHVTRLLRDPAVRLRRGLYFPRT